jgi:bacterial/archaeal transporter family protein
MPAWLVYILLATFAGGLSIALAKVGMKQASEHVVLFIRTGILFTSTLIVGLSTGELKHITSIDRSTFLILSASGITTALYWLLYFKALRLANVSSVAAIDKASIIVTVLFSVLVLKEQITLKALAGILLILLGCVIVVLES